MNKKITYSVLVLIFFFNLISPLQSISKNITCKTENDCPFGVCPNGGTYKKFSCLSGKCNELNFFADPCLSVTPGPSRSLTGIWKARLNKISNTSSSGSTDTNECIICIQVVPQCGPNEILIGQTCNMCAHCAKSDKTTSSLLHIASNQNTGSRIITLKLCVKNGELQGELNQTGVFNEGKIISEKITSKNEIEATFKDKNDLTTTLILKLLNNKSLLVTFSDGHTFNALKANSYKSCSKGNIPCSNKCGFLCCMIGETCMVDDPCMGDPACTSEPSFECIGVSP